jgi:hypothetical protein
MIIPDWAGKTHKEESKLKIGKANSILQTGENNSQYGTHLYIQKELSIKENTKRYREGNEPNGWITTTEWTKIQKQKLIQDNPKDFRLTRKWYTNGTTNFLIQECDIKEGMYPGQTRK